MSQYRQDHSLIMRSIVHMTDAAHSGIMPPSQLTTINQSQLSAQLGLNLGGTNLPHTSPSPPASKSATPSPSSSINEEDADESNRVSYSMCCSKQASHIHALFSWTWQYQLSCNVVISNTNVIVKWNIINLLITFFT